MKSCSSPLQTVPEEQNRKQQPLFRLLSGRIKFPLFLYLLIKNCDLLFCCHFRPQTTLEMAAFQQLLSATLLHPLATHRLTHFSCPRPQKSGHLHPLFPEGSSNASSSLTALHPHGSTENGLLQYPSSWSLVSVQPSWL